MARFAPALTIALSVSLLAPAPALAELERLALTRTELSASDQPDPPDPAYAATLSLVAPVVFALVTLPVAGPAAVIVAPLGAGVGHVYAGDPVRGALFSLGGLVVPALGMGLGLGAGMGVAQVTPANSTLGTVAVYGLVGGAVALAGYAAFAARDAHATAERRALSPVRQP